MNAVSSHHQDDDECAVFVDPNIRVERRRSILVASMALFSIVSLSALNFADVSAPWSYIFMCGIFAGSIALLWSVHAALSGYGADEFPHIVVDQDGVHFKSLQGDDGDMIAWSRINSVDRDEAAVILSFEPEELASNDPKKRISKIRIAVGEQRRAGLPAAIERYRSSTGQYR